MPLFFLSLAELIEIHHDQITRYGGSQGIRDQILLDSAIAQPQTTFSGQFLYADLFEMAAAYLFHLVMNHPFVDGNKRTGAVASIIFLEINGVELQAPENDLEQLVWQIAAGKLEKGEIVRFFNRWSVPKEPDASSSMPVQ